MSVTFQNALLSYDQVCIVKNMLAASQKTGRKAGLKALGYQNVEDIPQSDFMRVISRVAKQIRNAAAPSK
jgi:hypothetical protein